MASVDGSQRRSPTGSTASASSTSASSGPGGRFDFATIAESLRNASSLIGSATTRLSSNINVNDINLQNLKTVTSNISSNVASNINIDNISSITSNIQGRVQGIANLQNLQDGFQTVSAASLAGIQASAAGLEGLSKTIMDNIAEKKKALTNEEALKAKGNYQLLDTIKSIEYQLIAILFYFILAFLINWYLISGVEQTVTLVKNARDFVDDPNLEQKLREMKNNLQNDIKKYSNIDQLTEGMNEIRQGLTNGIKNSAKSLDLKLGIFADRDKKGSDSENDEPSLESKLDPGNDEL